MQLENSIKYYCSKNDMSIPELAEKIGMSFSGLYSALRNESLKVKTLKKISAVFNVSVYELLYVKEEGTESSIKIFVDHPLLNFLSKRYDNFSEKLLFYKDYFLWSIFHNLNKSKETYSPFPGINSNEYLIGQEEYDVLTTIPSEIREIPYSKWPQQYINQVKLFENIFESFYFIIFYYNFLNIPDYINDNVIKDKEILKYWSKWKSHKHPVITQYLD